MLFGVFAMQHHGILRTARIQTIVGIAVIVPLLIVGLVPLLTGDVLVANLFPLVPLSFQGTLGLARMLEPGIYDGSGVAAAMGDMVGGGQLVHALLVIMLLLALVLSIMTAMAGSSRPLYQGSIDGWLPRYLSHVNEHGAPTRAMWTDLCFNLLLLMMSDYVFVLAVSNCYYLAFN